MSECPYCSSDYQKIYHGGVCPRVAEIEYHPHGGIKRIRFHAPQLTIGGSPDPRDWRTVPDDFPNG